MFLHRSLVLTSPPGNCAAVISQFTVVSTFPHSRRWTLCLTYQILVIQSALATCACFCQILQRSPHISDEESLIGCCIYADRQVSSWGTLLYNVRAGAKESGFLSRNPVLLPIHVQSSRVTKHVGAVSGVTPPPWALMGAGAEF